MYLDMYSHAVKVSLIDHKEDPLNPVKILSLMPENHLPSSSLAKYYVGYIIGQHLMSYEARVGRQFFVVAYEQVSVRILMLYCRFFWQKRFFYLLNDHFHLTIKRMEPFIYKYALTVLFNVVETFGQFSLYRFVVLLHYYLYQLLLALSFVTTYPVLVNLWLSYKPSLLYNHHWFK